jgi:DNA-binding HxlR family transcriptional regulator
MLLDMASGRDVVDGDCSVFRTLAAIGDAWSWLVLREAILDRVERFDELQTRLGIARSTLAARLEHLTAGGILYRQAKGYVPTERGADFFGCLMTAMAWGDRWCTAGEDPPLVAVHAGCGRPMTAGLRCSHCDRPLQARQVRYERRPGAQDRRLAVPQRHRAPRLDLLERQHPSTIARTLQVMGDRWSGLVIREAFFGVRRFDEFQRRLAIATNILAHRLERLNDHGVLERVPYQHQPLRHEYRLTDKGLDLYPVPLAMLTWGDRWLAGRRPPVPLTHLECGRRFTAVLCCNHCGDPISRPDVAFRPAGAVPRRIRSSPAGLAEG